MVVLLNTSSDASVVFTLMFQMSMYIIKYFLSTLVARNNYNKNQQLIE